MSQLPCLPDELQTIIFGCLPGNARTSTRQLSRSHQTMYVRRTLRLPSPRHREHIDDALAFQVKVMQDCINLKSLCLGHAHVDIVDCLPDLTCLTSLVLRQGKFREFSVDNIHRPGFNLLWLEALDNSAIFANLVHVDMSGMAMDEVGCRFSAGVQLDFPNLKSFWAVGCEDLFGIWIAAPKLQELVLRGCTELYAFLGDGYPHLEVLDLGSCPQHCQMDLAKVLETSPRLRWLSLDGAWDMMWHLTALFHNEDPRQYLKRHSVVARCVRYLDVTAGDDEAFHERQAKLCVVEACPNVTELVG